MQRSTDRETDLYPQVMVSAQICWSKLTNKLKVFTHMEGIIKLWSYQGKSVPCSCTLMGSTKQPLSHSHIPPIIQEAILLFGTGFSPDPEREVKSNSKYCQPRLLTTGSSPFIYFKSFYKITNLPFVIQHQIFECIPEQSSRAIHDSSLCNDDTTQICIL